MNSSATATVHDGARATQAPGLTITLEEAIDFVNNRAHSSRLIAVETFFMKRLMEDLDLEERAACYYYLLRCRIQRTEHFETRDIHALYAKMHRTFLDAERNLREEGRREAKVVAQSQLRAFYQLTIYYYATLENIFLERHFEEAARHANEDKMEFRRRAYAAEHRIAHTIGYSLVGITSRYGNSFIRWGATTFFSILCFSSIYYIVDQFVALEHRIIPLGDPLFEYFYFSIVTFMTLGYGDIHPHTVPQMAIASVEVIMGYFMLGVLINMMNRSQ